VLTQRDVAKKFSVALSSVDSMLMPAVESGHLARSQSDEYGVIFRMPKRTPFPQPFTSRRYPRLRHVANQEA
jgi:hypothetical protein